MHNMQNKLEPQSSDDGMPDSALYKAMVQKALDLIPVLRERAARTEANRAILPETVNDFLAVGLFDIVKPRWAGGLELHPCIYLDALSAVAQGCPSSSWVLANLASHHALIALWPENIQTAVWSDHAAQVATSLIYTAGKVAKVGGGYEVTGRWPFSSGIGASQWVMLGAQLSDGSAPAEDMLVLLRRGEFEVIDTWHTVGLRGTGSNDVGVASVVVGEQRVFPLTQITGSAAPGHAINSSPLYRMPLRGLIGATLLCSVYGAARGAYEHFIHVTRTRLSRASGARIAEMIPNQIKIAEVSAKLDSAEMLIRKSYLDAFAMAQTDEGMKEQRALMTRRNLAYASTLCKQAVTTLFESSGAAGLYESDHLQRAWRDVYAGAAHFHLQWDHLAAAYGRVQLGVPSGMPGYKI